MNTMMRRRLLHFPKEALLVHPLRGHHQTHQACLEHLQGLLDQALQIFSQTPLPEGGDVHHDNHNHQTTTTAIVMKVGKRLSLDQDDKLGNHMGPELMLNVTVSKLNEIKQGDKLRTCGTPGNNGKPKERKPRSETRLFNGYKNGYDKINKKGTSTTGPAIGLNKDKMKPDKSPYRAVKKMILSTLQRSHHKRNRERERE